ncbi:TetR/AcrR family transcriptional regulator [Priestia megaterium]|uniref:TetR/AcrR family transcriptional regulator n=1 Tax=Priestia megaterium TaxID=1404 RepID=UPI002E23334D|nr:TetR/AcrR family transcriptional regulator [Priestia megaterium]MED4146841.1 TetR/AcrR family transcriptional regulator [Priestia megaterium]MED4169895.1 TetR/AcrR family transcriptional regulator [Priestia megaterium]MED4202207.1 TetR/AcrR family transcriptional regulator [Priestia megaterium]
MTFNQLKEASLRQFALNGYEGTSLSSLANEVGIKKQSIYTYFKSKEELFVYSFNESLSRELYFIENFFEGTNRTLPIEKLLYKFLIEYLDRYDKNFNTSFFIRTSFFPPQHLRELIIRDSYQLTNNLECLLEMLFKEKEHLLHSRFSADTATAAYLTILDGLFVEMLYGGRAERLEKRIASTWNVFWQGINGNKQA